MSDYLQRRLAIKLGHVSPQGAKEPKPLKKISDKKQAELKEVEKDSEGNTKKEKWFKERRSEMTGVCLFCGGKTERDNDHLFRHSIAHLLPKKKGIGGFPSVALHPDNWIELCYHGNSCHSNFDSGIITWEFIRDSAEWEVIAGKLKKVLPCIDKSERQYLPEVIKIETNFQL